MSVLVRFLALSTLVATLPPGGLAASGEETYRVRCALCHDSGATRAPRVGRTEDWVRRVEKGRAALLHSALEGVRDTAMLPRAGFRELSDTDVTAAVDYMLSTLGLTVPETSFQVTTRQPAQAAPVRIDDATLVASVADALRAKVGGVSVEAHDGRVLLRGVVESARNVRAAEEIARAVAGVVSVENRLIAADLFEHD